MSSEETQAGISIGDVTGDISLQAGGDINIKRNGYATKTIYTQFQMLGKL
ncbi:hypothetical protein [Candidatus Parabeggiatoa sp. HSG14]|nr:hypothetical protein [Thiotrichales bacterium HSG14]